MISATDHALKIETHGSKNFLKGATTKTSTFHVFWNLKLKHVSLNQDFLCFCSHFTPCFTIKYELRRFFQNHGSELYTGWWKEWRGNGSIILSKIIINTAKISIIYRLLSRCFKCAYWCNWNLILYFIIYINC